MSLLYGVWSRHGREIPREWREYLSRRGMRRHVSISDGDDRLSIHKIDIGAFAPGYASTDQHITALAGDPILTCGLRDRTHDLRAIDSGQLEQMLKNSRGYFNLARYDRSSHELTLANDRLGMRPLYLYDDGNYVVFSGAMNVIEKLPGIELTIDPVGVLEHAAFGFPLGDRTHYLEVKCLREGTIWRNGETYRYWEWQTQPVRQDVESVMDEMYAAFQEAVRLRKGSQSKVVASLSGGLDSRCVATELWRQAAEVTSLNCSWPGSYDDVLGRMYAKRLGFNHRFKERPLNDSGGTLTHHLYELAGAKQIWAGNDASLTLGHNRQTQAVIDKLRAGDKLGAAEEFLRTCRIALSGKLLKGDWSKGAEAVPLTGLLNELPDCNERSLWFFRLRNHHRRISYFHFEQIDMVSFEFIEPLADPEVIQLCASLPIGFCLYHRMYHEWLKRFPKEITSVAWQSYPGHLPCPIELPAGYAQWAAPTRSSRSRMDALWKAFRHLDREPSQFLSRTRTALAYLLHAAGRDTSHLLKQAELIDDASRWASDGRGL